MNCCGGLKPPLVSPAGRSEVWFEPRRAYEPFDLDGPRFRAAVGRYEERADDLLAELHYGLVLGSEAVVEQWRQRLSGRRDRERPQLQALQGHGSLEERLTHYAGRLGLGAEEVAELAHPVRHRERPERDALMYLLWREGRFRLGQIAPYFGVGYAAVSQACRRTERRLETDRRFQRMLRAAMQ
jgi:hypothetical protein